MRRKSFFYLFALLCSMSLCVACSDDDGPEKANIPSTPIESGDLVVSINGSGVSTTGTATFEVKNASEAVLTMNNIIPGYSEVAVDVELEPMTESAGSYKFAGEAHLTTPPSAVTTKMANTPVFMIVSVNGTVTSEGKSSVSVSTELSEWAQGGLANTWKLQDYIHAENEDWGALAAPFLSAPLYVKWTAKDAGQPNMGMIADLATAFGSTLVFPALNEVTLHADGNITAKYWESDEMVMAEQGDVIMQDDGSAIAPLYIGEEHPWLSSPKNLAFWYTASGYAYVVPNVTAIIGEAGAGEELFDSEDLAEIMAILAEYDIDINQVMPIVTTWMKTGVPLKYKQEGTALKFYVDQELANPIMEILFPVLKKLDAKMDEILASEDEINNMPEGDDKDEMLETLETVQMVKTIMNYMLGLENFAAIETIWKENTDEFEVSLGFDNTLHPVARSLAPAKAANERMEQMKKFFPAVKQLMKK